MKENTLCRPQTQVLISDKSNDRIELTTSYEETFYPNETKTIDIKIDQPSTAQLTGQQLCQFNINPFKEKFEAICNFNKQGMSKAIFCNRSNDVLRLNSNMSLGYIDPDERFEHTDATPIIENITEPTIKSITTSDACFCEEKQVIIGHFHHDGLTDYSEVNLLTIEGNLHTHDLFFYEPATSQLFINKNKRWNKQEFEALLINLPPRVEIKINCSQTTISLRQSYIINQMTKLAQATHRTVSNIKFNTTQCFKHQKWRVLTTPHLWVHVSFSSQHSDQYTVDKSERPESFVQSILNNKEFDQIHQIKHWGETINLHISKDERLLIADLQINSVKQRYESYIKQFIQTFLHHYLGSTLYAPSLTFSTNRHPSYSNVIDILLNLNHETAPTKEIAQLIDHYHIHHQKIDIIQIKKSETIHEVRTSLQSFNSEDVLHNLDMIQEILEGKLDPLEQSIQSLPRLPNTREIKNTTYEIETNKIQEDYAKINICKKKLADIQKLIPDEALDNQSEMTNISKLTDLPSLIPQQYLPSPIVKEEITNWR